MKVKKSFLIIFCFFLSASFSFGQDDPFGDGGLDDPGGEPIPLPGAVYFLIAALGVGAKKLYDSRKRF